jgi:hypothetical protein
MPTWSRACARLDGRAELLLVSRRSQLSALDTLAERVRRSVLRILLPSLTAVGRRQSASDFSIALHKIPIPALATTTSNRPRCSSVTSITPGQLSWMLTS